LESAISNEASSRTGDGAMGMERAIFILFYSIIVPFFLNNRYVVWWCWFCGIRRRMFMLSMLSIIFMLSMPSPFRTCQWLTLSSLIQWVQHKQIRILVKLFVFLFSCKSKHLSIYLYILCSWATRRNSTTGRVFRVESQTRKQNPRKKKKTRREESRKRNKNKTIRIAFHRY
jgi:hypothetical protein